MINAFIDQLRGVNRFILVIFCFVFFPVAPIGLIFGLVAFLCVNAMLSKRASFYIFTVAIILYLVLIILFYSPIVNYFKAMWNVLNNAWNLQEPMLLLKVWYSNWPTFKYGLTTCGFIPAIWLQGFSFANFIVLRSPEILHKVIKSEELLEAKGLRKAEKTVNKLDGYSFNNAVLLGASANSSKAFALDDKEINSHVLISGTTGAGKTVTVKNFIVSACERDIRLIYLDGKGDGKLPGRVREMCEKNGRKFKLFEMKPDAKIKYNPMTCGGFTELKDKIVTMKSVDSSDGRFYQTAEGEYLQFLLKVMQRLGKPLDLYSLGSYITMPALFELVAETKDKDLQNEAIEIKSRLSDKLDGIISDINTMIKSDIGHLFDCQGCSPDEVIDLDSDLRAENVVYFSLNDLNYADYAARVGKLIINDLKAVFGRVSEDEPLKTFGIFDEFTAFAGEQFNTILSRTRSKGLCAIVATQSIETITHVSAKLASDLVSNCNTFIIHRQNSDNDAEKLSDIIGKHSSYDVSFHASGNMSDGNTTNIGNSQTYKKIRKYLVEPEKIQRLGNGTAYVVRKANNFSVDLVRVRHIE